ncbi:inositol 2-dehydrogenase [Bowdeniella nasicola]|uniref:Inositol 2-dehydrogenase n=1 Tax=Bowdeniella nasicola TaxID=208480 RepID=A0A1Q5Q280_9ACTO|nr:inositol 2-dehydrogenase [Bowdeniella nasicola]OKL53825.1 inositol 2-dehydrogenase [Bowdeniella nasicola]
MRIGILGAGRIAKVHARSIAAHPGASVAMIADPCEDAARELAEAHGARHTADPAEVISDPEVDAIIICSPTPLHAEQILAAAKVGKPVLCEKPIAMDTETIDKLFADLEGLDPQVMLGFNRRFDPSFAKVRRLVDGGVIGKVEQVTIISRDPAAPPREYLASSGGIFKDMTIHEFDMARFFLGDIATVFAVGQNLDPELADSGDFDGAIITLTNADGVAATITNSRHCSAGYDQRLEVFGDKATVNADNIRETTVQVSTGEATDAKDPYLDFFLERYDAAYRLELAEFIDAVENKRTPSPSLKDGAAALAIAEAAEKSARTGTPVTL